MSVMICDNCSSAWLTCINWSKHNSGVAQLCSSRKYVIRSEPHPMQCSVLSHGVPKHPAYCVRVHVFVVLGKTFLKRSKRCSTPVAEGNVPVATLPIQVLS